MGSPSHCNRVISRAYFLQTLGRLCFFLHLAFRVAVRRVRARPASGQVTAGRPWVAPKRDPWDLIAWSQETGMRQVVLQPSSWATSRVGVLCIDWLAASHATVVNFRARECDRVACLACMKPCENQAWRGMVGPTIHNPRTHEGGGGRSTRNFRPSSIAHQAGNKSGIFSNDHKDHCLVILSHMCLGMAWSWF